MPVAPRSRLVAYLAALGAVALAAAVDLALLPWISPSVAPAFLLAVAVAAYYGGFLPGVVASLASVTLLVYFFYPPTAALIGQTTVLRILNYLATATGLTIIGGLASRSRRLALDQARENGELRRRAETAVEKLQSQAEAARGGAEALSRLAAIVTSSRDAIVGKTLDGVVTTWNAGAERTFGYSAAEMIGQSIYRLIPDDRHDAERDLLERLRRGESVELEEAERIRKDGERIWITLSVSPVRDAEGRLVGAASIKRDITERRRAEAELRRHQDQLRLAHRAARIGAWHWDVASRLLTWDDGLRQLYGLGPDEQVRDLAGFLARVHPEDRERVEASFQRALQGGGGLGHEYRIVMPSGEIRWLADLGQVGVDAEGRPIYITGIGLDITERRAAEERLREAHRLQAAGQLAGGIAHEANNQMSVVLGAVHFLLRRRDLPETAAADVELVRRAAERTATITQQLLAFSRRQLLRLENLDLNALVRAAEPLLRRSLAETQELVVRTGELPGLVRADHNQLEQVLLNLVLNARDAMPNGGQVTIETGGRGQDAELTVRDDGLGMDQQTLRRAFEPFFTTKEVGQGTGLGLSVVHGIVAQMGGRIEAESQPGRGSTFTLRLPIVPATTPGAEARGAAPAAPPGGTTIMVVEDDEAVRRMTVRALGEAGYATMEAADGKEALRLVADRAKPPDLVVTDLGMPRMDGHELARRLRADHPTVPVLLISGHVDPDPQPVDGEPWPLLRKPFPPEELIRYVGDMLGTRATPTT
ncbi:MAG TPA: PAS domain S-box protein [Gemmatimonadales bacterium]|nr:PAS domain S-box protein [Gemmatimonadales bacterium]